MAHTELYIVLEEHKKWLETFGKEGKRAKLSGANLSGANLSGAKLRDVDFSGANLRDADLRNVDLICANLRNADLRNADLTDANLRGADLRGADLRDADLIGVDLDYSAFPLRCGGLDAHIDDRQATQFLYHLVRNVLYSKNTSKELKKLLGSKELIEQANKFHRAEECGRICGENA